MIPVLPESTSRKKIPQVAGGRYQNSVELSLAQLLLCVRAGLVISIAWVMPEGNVLVLHSENTHISSFSTSTVWNQDSKICANIPTHMG